MDKGKNILEWCLLIAKIIFTIVLIVLGIKLIMFMFFPYLPIHIFVSSFEPFDWNPIATIGGAILTGLITWFAVYKTSELDKNARKLEKIYVYYQKEILDLNNYVINLTSFNNTFRIDKDLPDKKKFVPYSEKYCDIDTMREIRSILSSLGVYDKKWRDEKYINMVDDFINIQLQYNLWLSETINQSNKNDLKIFEIKDKNVSFDVCKFFEEIKNSKLNINYDFEKNREKIEEIQCLINNEFKMD